MKAIKITLLFVVEFAILHSVIPGSHQSPFWDLFALIQHLWR